MSARDERRANGWFEKHVVSQLSDLGNRCASIETKQDELKEQVRQRELVVEERLTRVEERSSRKAKIWGSVGSAVAILVAIALEMLLS